MNSADDTVRKEGTEFQLPSDKKLNISALSELFTVMNQSYKLLWFRGILAGIGEGKDVQSFEEIVDRMVADAWYPVLGLHLSLGLVDAVESLIKLLSSTYGLPADAKTEEIIEALKTNEDKEIHKLKVRLIQFAPYRLQSPFMEGSSWRFWDDYDLTIARINSDASMIYTLAKEKSLSSQIQIRPDWMDYLSKNLVIIYLWTDDMYASYLEKRNPETNGIRGKLGLPEKKEIKKDTKQASDSAEKTKMTFSKKTKNALTPKQKLWRRIKREFPKKKLIGDIAINDEEFALLVQELNDQHRRVMTQPDLFEADEVFCVAMVQFGIRYYNDGAFWPFVEQRVNPGHFKIPHRTQFGNEFLRFMTEHNKILNNNKKAMSNILLHGFVSDPKAADLFSFLYSYYSIDLARDIDRLDKDAMNALIESIKANDGRNRTYNLVEHTADAVRQNEKGCKIRLRRYLKLIDRAFWNPEEFSARSGNRLMRRFAEWCNSDDEKITKERKDSRNYISKHRGGWKPYLSYDFKNDDFLLTLPARLVRGEVEPIVYWAVRYGDIEEKVATSVEAAVTGYVTKEISITLTNQEVFGSFEVFFAANGEQLAKWKIAADPIRFFETNGDHVEPKALRPGDVVSFSDLSYAPTSEAMYHKETWSGLLRCSYQFEDGDLIAFPDKKVLSIGKKPAEGLLRRGLQSGAYGETEGERNPVYAAPPSLFARILPKSMNGTQLRVNGQNYRLFENGEPQSGVIAFDLQERVPEEGVHIALGQFGIKGNGLYHVELDIPNDHANRRWDFMLIDGLEYSFDEAPYIFVENGVLCVPAKTGFKKHDEIIREGIEDDQLRFAFTIPEEDEYFRLELDGVPVAFEVPKLSYRFQKDESWRTKLQLSIWHKELPDIVEVKFPTDRITILLDEEGNEDEDEEQHSRTYYKNQEKNCFVCDLHSFKSWFGKRVAMRRLYVQLPEMSKPARFLNVYTRSLFVSAVLSADLKNDIIRGEFDIIGKTTCYADIWFEDELLLEKEQINDGRLSFETEIRSGNYRVDVFESEDDEDGFDEPDYEQIGSKTMELINPSNLTGKHIEVTQLTRNDSETYLRLKRSYTLYDLQPMKDREKGYYSGHMVVREREFGAYRNDYEACVRIPNIEELSKGHLFWLNEYGEREPFIYDTDRHFLVKEEDKKVSRIFRYQRYALVWEDEYVYHISFVEKPDEWEKKIQYERAAKEYQKNQKEREIAEAEFRRKGDSLSIPITQMGLSVQTFNALRRGGVETSTDLLTMCTQGTIYKMRNMGRRNIEECIEKLRRIGYRI